MTILWRNGEILRGQPSLDPSLAGWGAFSTVGCDGGHPLLWKRHRARLAASLAHLGADAGIRFPDTSLLQDLLAECGLRGPARMRVVGYRGGASGWVVEASASRCDCAGPHVSPCQLSVERWSSAPPLIGHKTLARLPWDLARISAVDHGADDALIVDGAGEVLETAVANVWIVQGRELRTPPAPTHCLPGVMRGWLLEHAAGIGLDVFETGLTAADVDGADEVWVSNAAVGVRRVGRVEDRVWRRWPVFDRLKSFAIPAPGWCPSTRDSID